MNIPKLHVLLLVTLTWKALRENGFYFTGRETEAGRSWAFAEASWPGACLKTSPLRSRACYPEG